MTLCLILSNFHRAKSYFVTLILIVVCSIKFLAFVKTRHAAFNIYEVNLSCFLTNEKKILRHRRCLNGHHLLAFTSSLLAHKPTPDKNNKMRRILNSNSRKLS